MQRSAQLPRACESRITMSRCMAQYTSPFTTIIDAIITDGFMITVRPALTVLVYSSEAVMQPPCFATALMT